jgi:hypothetical protein
MVKKQTFKDQNSHSQIKDLDQEDSSFKVKEILGKMAERMSKL